MKAYTAPEIDIVLLNVNDITNDINLPIGDDSEPFDPSSWLEVQES